MTLPLGKIICGDAVEEMRRLPDSSIDLVITSPPYNLKNSTGNGLKYDTPHGVVGGKKHTPGQTTFIDGRNKQSIYKGDQRRGKYKLPIMNGYDQHADNMPHGEYVEWQITMLREAMRLLKPTGAIFYNHKVRVQGGVWLHHYDILHEFPVRQQIIWTNKPGINFNPSYFLPAYETIYMIAMKDFKLQPHANRYQDVWGIAREKEAEKHPASFPVALPTRIISSSLHNEVVLDPFMGSGTTAIAAHKCGVSFVGIDNSPKYCKIARRRVEDTQRQKRMEL